MLVFGILRSSSLLMDCSCMAPRTPIAIVIRGFVFQPWFLMLLISGSYLVCLCVRACSGTLSWQYVNSINCFVYACDGDRGVGVWFGVPNMHRIYGFDLAWQWQGVCVHVHFISHSGTVCSWFVLLMFLAFVKV